MDKIDITGLDAAEILARLYNEARPLGMGMLQDAARGGKKMDREEAAALLVEARSGDRSSFDYVAGRPLKVWFHYEGDAIVALSGARLYDRDQGMGHCEQVVNDVRAERA